MAVASRAKWKYDNFAWHSYYLEISDYCVDRAWASKNNQLNKMVTREQIELALDESVEVFQIKDIDHDVRQ